MAGYWYAGLWVPAVTHYYLISLAVALPAIYPRQSGQSPAARRFVPEIRSRRPGLQ